MKPGIRRRSHLGRLFDEGRWPLSLIDSARKQAESSRRSSDWITYVDICNTLKGMSLNDCTGLREQCRASHCLSTKLRLKLGNIICTGDFQSHVALSERQLLCQEFLGEQESSFASASMDILASGYLGSFIGHYPALLTNSTGRLGREVHSSWLQNKYRSKAMRLRESSISLQNALCQHLYHSAQCKHNPASQAGTVAVVGNSPDLLRQGKGEEIDSHDLIVRFNKISAENDQEEHTGKRTDIWIMSPATPIKLCPPDARLVVVSGLHSLTRPSFYWRNLVKLGKPLAEFDSSVWYELVRRFNAPPSAGTLAIAALRASELNLQIHRFGFTTTLGVHGSSPNHHNDQAQVSTRHNWQAEVNWLRDSVS